MTGVLETLSEVLTSLCEVIQCLATGRPLAYCTTHPTIPPIPPLILQLSRPHTHGQVKVDTSLHAPDRQTGDVSQQGVNR